MGDRERPIAHVCVINKSNRKIQILASFDCLDFSMSDSKSPGPGEASDFWFGFEENNLPTILQIRSGTRELLASIRVTEIEHQDYQLTIPPVTGKPALKNTETSTVSSANDREHLRS